MKIHGSSGVPHKQVIGLRSQRHSHRIAVCFLSSVAAYHKLSIPLERIPFSLKIRFVKKSFEILQFLSMALVLHMVFQ
jgi:hypothetical protein